MDVVGIMNDKKEKPAVPGDVQWVSLYNVSAPDFRS
jgi:hypothetical protein